MPRARDKDCNMQLPTICESVSIDEPGDIDGKPRITETQPITLCQAETLETRIQVISVQKVHHLIVTNRGDLRGDKMHLGAYAMVVCGH